MNLKRALQAELDDLSAPDGWRRERRIRYVRPIVDGIEAWFSVTINGRRAPHMVLGYVSVYCEAVHRLVAELRGERFKSRREATFGYALNGLTPKKGETGIWMLDDGTVDAVAHAAYRDSIRYGEPIWNGHRSIEAVAETLTLPDHRILTWQPPAAYYLAGKPDEALAAARRRVEEAGEDAAFLGFEAFLQRLEDRIASDRS